MRSLFRDIRRGNWHIYIYEAFGFKIVHLKCHVQILCKYKSVLSNVKKILESLKLKQCL